MGRLAQMVEERHQPAAKVKVQRKPSRQVLATADCRKGEIVFAPDAVHVKPTHPTEFAQASGQHRVKAGFVPEDPDIVYELAPLCTEEIIGALWAVAPVDEECEANMTWASCLVTVVTAFDFPGRLQDGAFDCPRCIKIPVMINHQAVKQGDELRVYKQREEKASRPAAPILISQVVAKKAKTAEDR
jgi:hypothetical protein